MDANFILELIKQVQQTDFMEVEVEQEGKRIKISRRVSEGPMGVVSPLPMPMAPVSQSPVAAPPAKDASPSAPMSSNTHAIRSPMVGTYYKAAAPDKPAFVSVGDRIEVGQVLCIIEAMKLMNEVTSEVSGKVVKILIENSQPVEYDQPLFEVELS